MDIRTIYRSTTESTVFYVIYGELHPPIPGGSAIGSCQKIHGLLYEYLLISSFSTVAETVEKLVLPLPTALGKSPILYLSSQIVMQPCVLNKSHQFMAHRRYCSHMGMPNQVMEL